jgi:hypothetical protein
MVVARGFEVVHQTVLGATHSRKRNGAGLGRRELMRRIDDDAYLGAGIDALHVRDDDN